MLSGALSGAVGSIYLVLVVTRIDRLWTNSAAGGHLSDALVSHGVTAVTESSVFHLARAEDAAWWR